MPFEEGNPGRPKGATGKLNKTFKELLLVVLNEVQSHPTSNLQTFAEENPKEFYQIAGRLIPTEVNAVIENKVINVIAPDDGL